LKKTFFKGLLVVLLHFAALPAMAQTTPPDSLPHASGVINKADSTDAVFIKVEMEATFPGGETAWRKFLEKNLNPAVPANNRAPAGTYTVVIQFVVDRDGKVWDIKPLTSLGYGMEAEVMRILRKSPDWSAARLEGRTVRAYRKQPVTFMVIEEEKKQKRKNRD
jgi:outer membrane biosynthesis protein TonB